MDLTNQYIQMNKLPEAPFLSEVVRERPSFIRGGEDNGISFDKRRRVIQFPKNVELQIYLNGFLKGIHSQRDFFTALVKPKIDQFLTGKDITVVVYGTPYSGKSYTLFGAGLDPCNSESDYGILPRISSYVFEENRSSFGTCDTGITISACEVTESNHYIDLLEREDKTALVQACTDGKSTRILGLNSELVHSSMDMMRVLNYIMKYRQVLYYSTSQNVFPNKRTHPNNLLIWLQLRKHDPTDKQGRKIIQSQALFCILGRKGFMPRPESYEFNTTYDVWMLFLCGMKFEEPIVDFRNHLDYLVLQNSFNRKTETLVICCLTPSPNDLEVDFLCLRGLSYLQDEIRRKCINYYITREAKDFINTWPNEWVVYNVETTLNQSFDRTCVTSESERTPDESGNIPMYQLECIGGIANRSNVQHEVQPSSSVAYTPALCFTGGIANRSNVQHEVHPSSSVAYTPALCVTGGIANRSNVQHEVQPSSSVAYTPALCFTGGIANRSNVQHEVQPSSSAAYTPAQPHNDPKNTVPNSQPSTSQNMQQGKNSSNYIPFQPWLTKSEPLRNVQSSSSSHILDDSYTRLGAKPKGGNPSMWEHVLEPSTRTKPQPKSKRRHSICEEDKEHCDSIKETRMSKKTSVVTNSCVKPKVGNQRPTSDQATQCTSQPKESASQATLSLDSGECHSKYFESPVNLKTNNHQSVIGDPTVTGCPSNSITCLVNEQIRTCRQMRSIFEQVKQSLEQKIHNQTYTPAEQREYLIAEEIISMSDLLICSANTKKELESPLPPVETESKKIVEADHTFALDILGSFDMKSLFINSFTKVIDLLETCKSLEVDILRKDTEVEILNNRTTELIKMIHDLRTKEHSKKGGRGSDRPCVTPGPFPQNQNSDSDAEHAVIPQNITKMLVQQEPPPTVIKQPRKLIIQKKN